ncbi:hypothetical protein MNBD_GAMMA05-405 [hydrothermal vent metagenome]|uniref:Uncharacterized protein n=1 Tax=hydrothermal vent metagenome TaxID=652676 RepID=A0A3B0WC00_9ZZZZ
MVLNTNVNDSEEDQLEQIILQESIVSAAGLNSEQVLIGIKGDPSLRESAPLRKRYDSKVDSLFDQLEPNLEDIMLNRGIYRIFVGFNSGEIRTNSVFDPLRQEIHDAEKIADTDYINRHFPLIDYNDKVELMRELYTALRASKHYQNIPGYWQNILNRRSQHWLPLEPENISKVLSTVRTLRDIEEYYLRNITMCIVQGIVRMQFNCDGTQIIDAHNFKHFLEENV